jgi:dUTP pyrophosphatase
MMVVRQSTLTRGELMYVSFKKLDPRAVTPKFQTAGAAAVDLHALERVWIGPGCRELVKTGLAFEIPSYFVGLVCSRSGLALKQGVTVINAPGVVDADYRGDVGVALINDSGNPFIVEPGDRIAQFMIVPIAPVAGFREVDELSSTERGAGGFGSTGGLKFAALVEAHEAR